MGMNFQDDFSNKVCVVTGGAGGIGRCTTELFLKAGAKVCVIDRSAKAIAHLGLLRAEWGIEEDALFCFEGDIAEKEILEDFSKAVIARFGHVDCLVHNACFGRRGILSGCSYEDFEYVQRIGVIAPYYLTLLFKPYLTPGSSIVNITSTRAFQSQADTESYSAAKGGIAALTHALSVSLAGLARVNAIAPGWIDTGAYHEKENYVPEYQPGDLLQHPAGRVGEPKDIASMILYLCSSAAGFIDGQTIRVDGGMSKLMVYHADEGWQLNSP